MLSKSDLLRQYQIRSINCNSKYQLANKLLLTHGFEHAAQICKNNHWAGVLQTLQVMHKM